MPLLARAAPCPCLPLPGLPCCAKQARAGLAQDVPQGAVSACRVGASACPCRRVRVGMSGVSGFRASSGNVGDMSATLPTGYPLPSSKIATEREVSSRYVNRMCSKSQVDSVTNEKLWNWCERRQATMPFYSSYVSLDTQTWNQNCLNTEVGPVMKSTDCNHESLLY